MGDFASINDDDAELLSGGRDSRNPSRSYGSCSNYEHFKKDNDSDHNPGSFYDRSKRRS